MDFPKWVPLQIFIVFFFLGCQNEIRPIVTFHNDNVLQPKIEFTTSADQTVKIQYWPEGYRHKALVSNSSTGRNHSIILQNVKQTTRYNYVITGFTIAGSPKVFAFETGFIPNEVVRVNKTKPDSTIFSGYILIRKLAPKGSDVILDKNGDIVWYHVYDTVVRRPFLWTAKNTILSQYDSAHIVEYDNFGKQTLNLKLSHHGIANVVHHEVLLNQNDDLVTLTIDSAKRDVSKFGGSNNQYIKADGILVLSRLGRKIWEWNLLDHYNISNASHKALDFNQALGHANSMVIADDGNYTVSFRDFSQVWKINASDGTVMWRLGKAGDFQMNSEHHFNGQHSIHYNGRGELMMFDNGDKSGRRPSRILSFKLDERTMIAETKVAVTLPLELSAFKMCSAELISEGKYLVCTSKRNGIISVVNDKAEILWRIDLSSPSYRAYYLPDPFKSTIN
jgi:arylsulfate sulfotransferase